MNPRTRSSLDERCRLSKAFTLIELLVVIAVVGILAALLISVLSEARKKAQVPVCLNNARQLQMAWIHFADDNDGELLSNTDYSNFAGRGLKYNWVYGAIGYETTGGDFAYSTDPNKVVDPKFNQIGPYIQSGKVFKCPGDKSYFLKNGMKVSRNRSFSMNEWMGNHLPSTYPGSTYTSPVRRMMTRDSVRSEDFFVFIEEHEDSIDDGQFRITTSPEAVSLLLVTIFETFPPLGTITPRRSPLLMGGLSCTAGLIHGLFFP